MTTRYRKPITILVADDDPDDRLMIQEAVDEAHCANPIEFVNDGAELMDYLHRRGEFTDRDGEQLPGMILLDRRPSSTSLVHPCGALRPFLAVRGPAVAGPGQKSRLFG